MKTYFITHYEFLQKAKEVEAKSIEDAGLVYAKWLNEQDGTDLIKEPQVIIITDENPIGQDLEYIGYKKIISAEINYSTNKF